MVQAMSEECPQVDQRAEYLKFVDHWRAQSGAKGIKADWDATWRNWIRRAAEYRGGSRPAVQSPMDRAAAVADLAHRLEAETSTHPQQLQIGF